MDWEFLQSIVPRQCLPNFLVGEEGCRVPPQYDGAGMGRIEIRKGIAVKDRGSK
ncbi:MAG: hypothetical protein ACRC8K_18590 [Waterburya sp.]